MDYMTQPHELKKQPDAAAMIQAIANSAPEERRVAVANALWSFWNFAHAFDDLIDGSGWPDSQKELAWKALQEFVSDLLLNPFYREHAAEMRAMFTMAICRAIDGDAMAASDKLERRVLAPAVRCADIDVLAHMAYLAGGWKIMRAFGQARDYDVADAPPTDSVDVAHV